MRQNFSHNHTLLYYVYFDIIRNSLNGRLRRPSALPDGLPKGKWCKRAMVDGQKCTKLKKWWLTRDYGGWTKMYTIKNSWLTRNYSGRTKIYTSKNDDWQVNSQRHRTISFIIIWNICSMYEPKCNKGRWNERQDMTFVTPYYSYNTKWWSDPWCKISFLIRGSLFPSLTWFFS